MSIEILSEALVFSGYHTASEVQMGEGGQRTSTNLEFRQPPLIPGGDIPSNVHIYSLTELDLAQLTVGKKYKVILEEVPEEEV